LTTRRHQLVDCQLVDRAINSVNWSTGPTGRKLTNIETELVLSYLKLALSRLALSYLH